jgi:uncharacterized phage-like protein YoqJ
LNSINEDKIVAFAGHRHEWHCIGVEKKLLQAIEELIQKGYTIFYDGNYGAFDRKCVDAVLKLKRKYPHIKLIRILAYYHHDKERYELPPSYDGSLYPDLEEVYPKQIITKRNEWIVDNCDILVYHIENTYNSGACRTVKYAQKHNKPIIYI